MYTGINIYVDVLVYKFRYTYSTIFILHSSNAYRTLLKTSLTCSILRVMGLSTCKSSWEEWVVWFRKLILITDFLLIVGGEIPAIY